MLGETDPQVNFFDSYVEEYFLPQEHELLEIKKNVDFSFIKKETRDLYAHEKGRPSYPSEVMFKILFLEFYYNLSDVEVVKQLKFNVLFRYFTALKAEGPIPDDTSLVVFRKRLGEKRFERIFDEFVNQCKKKGLLHEKLKVIDATHIIADVAIPNTINLLREGRRRVLRQITEERKELQEPLEKYLPEQDTSCREPNREEALAKELALSKQLIKKVKGKYSSHVEKQVRLLQETVEPEKKRTLVSFVDPEARFGRKSKGTKFAGYKAHIVADESHIVTSVETLPGNENEGNETNVERILEKEDAKGLRGEAVVADALYDSLANRKNIARRGMKHYIPEKRKIKKVNDFIYSDEEDKLICPKGHASLGKTPYENGYLYYFSLTFCRECERKVKCSLNKERARVYLSDSHLLFLQTDPEQKRKALKRRKRIEAKFGEVKKHHQMARARYRGRWRVAIQVFMSFIVANLKRMIKLLQIKENRMELALSSG